MKVIQIKDIIRKDVPIYYRMFYSGVLVLDLMNTTVERQLDFTVETMPTGVKAITAALAQPVDYPLVPLIKEIKKHINDLSDRGKLPV
ncbi:MAG: hypothetical protein LBD08_01185 [Treponema sp.]|jgi:hypothetical protein|nr:hypothetical protein [Treponema sp.]